MQHAGSRFALADAKLVKIAPCPMQLGDGSESAVPIPYYAIAPRGLLKIGRNYPPTPPMGQIAFEARRSLARSGGTPPSRLAA